MSKIPDAILQIAPIPIPFVQKTITYPRMNESFQIFIAQMYCFKQISPDLQFYRIYFKTRIEKITYDLGYAGFELEPYSDKYRFRIKFPDIYMPKRYYTVFYNLLMAKVKELFSTELSELKINDKSVIIGQSV